MNLQQLIKVFSDKSCQKIYVKHLAANDNSKNQVYFGDSFDILNIFPLGEISVDKEGDRKVETFKSKISFYWSDYDGRLIHAPNAQLILYPEYPEIRFSGFLKSAKGAPSELMASRLPGRILFLGISDDKKIIGYVAPVDSQISNEFLKIGETLENIGVFKIITIQNAVIQKDTKGQLLKELKRIYNLGWINSKRLNAQKNILPCVSPNCGGYTLEAELGISPNGYSEPDYLGWEIKQFSVKNFNTLSSSIITLMTPEPTHGFYVEAGVEDFIRTYGYEDKKGREARQNFGGIHKYGILHVTTKLKLVVEGFDSKKGVITNPRGFIGLIDVNDKLAASWSFTSLLKHWNNKHANACYVPSMKRSSAISISKIQYAYGNNVILGQVTDFVYFLQQVEKGNIYYDPGIKLEFAIAGVRKQNIKRRSQFRIKSGNLLYLYKSNEIIDVLKF